MKLSKREKLFLFACFKVEAEEAKELQKKYHKNERVIANECN